MCAMTMTRPERSPASTAHRAARLTLAALTTVGSAAVWTACSSPTGPTRAPSLAPQVTCPADVSQQTPTGAAVTVTYQVPAAVDGSPPVQVACTPPSGSTFPLGQTTVTCTATDVLGREGTCAFHVNVTTPPRLRLTSFLAFGDSMTEGVLTLTAPYFDLTPSPTGYPEDLQVLLAARYTAQTITVDNEGLPGEEAVQGVVRLPGVLGEAHPQVVLLLEGANDLNTYGAAALSDTAAAMQQMVVTSQNAGAVVYLAGLPPQRAGGLRAGAADLVPAYNARLATVASTTHAVFVDLYAAFGGVPDDLIGSDGLHPTVAGYQKIADTFFAAIQSTLEVAPQSTVRRAVKR
jgi:lysophospholipase L1-like esterase